MERVQRSTAIGNAVVAAWKDKEKVNKEREGTAKDKGYSDGNP